VIAPFGAIGNSARIHSQVDHLRRK